MFLGAIGCFRDDMHTPDLTESFDAGDKMEVEACFKYCRYASKFDERGKIEALHSFFVGNSINF